VEKIVRFGIWLMIHLSANAYRLWIGFIAGKCALMRKNVSGVLDQDCGRVIPGNRSEARSAPSTYRFRQETLQAVRLCARPRQPDCRL
jgi:hypothetical protein